MEASLRAAALDDATNLVFTASGLIPARSPDEIAWRILGFRRW